ncbi:hypothetical protein [Streptomyces goshikiensis]|uniref:hypothetical protein n=1 Tax=Streptomyces goshikiensis TaxID=1942 RepID=UPI0036D037C3
MDALGRAADKGAAVCELGRVLAPGGRVVMTRSLRRGAEPAWEAQARTAGLVVEHVDERPAEPGVWERLYRLWAVHADELRRELGEVQTQSMLREAREMLPTLPGRRAVLLTLGRPATGDRRPATGDRRPATGGRSGRGR